ncbi:MAG: hypothetical protein Q9160_008536 [Pyrenula sp. 1 TL-2023]
MAAESALQPLVWKIQEATANFEKGESNGVIQVQNALDALQRAVEPSHVQIMKQRFHSVQNVTLVMALEMGLLGALSSSPTNSLTADDLASSSGYNKQLIVRVMRMMTALKFADEVDFQTYKANDVTITQMDPGWLGTLLIVNEWVLSYGAHVRKYLRQNKPCDMNSTESLYEFANGESFWETMKKDAISKKAFDNAMSTRTKFSFAPWHDKFPARSRIDEYKIKTASNPVIVDIGGNQGVDLHSFATANADLECELFLQDLPETIKNVPAGLDPRIKPTAHDFFNPQSIKGAAIYYLKTVLHDWNDVKSIELLSRTATAMTNDSTLLIHDMVLSDRNESLVRADMDIHTMLAMCGCERTYTQWKELLAAARPPLRLVKVWSSLKDPQSIVEAVLAGAA